MPELRSDILPLPCQRKSAEFSDYIYFRGFPESEGGGILILPLDSIGGGGRVLFIKRLVELPFLTLLDISRSRNTAQMLKEDNVITAGLTKDLIC